MFEHPRQVTKAVQEGFHRNNILVVGDLILDHYLWGEVKRISPEAPVPVVHTTHENYVGGGAANVANNLAGLGIAATIAGIIGDDPEGDRLLATLEKVGVGNDGIITVPGRPTICKTRVIGGHQQMLRMDREESAPVPEIRLEALLHSVQALVSQKPALVVLSDYAKGTLTEKVSRAIIAEARKQGVPVLVDPKGKDYRKYAGATAVSPNRQELSLACDYDDDLTNLLSAGEQLRKSLDLEFLVVTLGDQGIALIDDTHHQRIPALARSVYDVSGAGDTVIATLAAGLAAGLTRLDAVHLANLAGGVVVGKVGTAPIMQEELLASISNEAAQDQSNKFVSLEEAVRLVTEWRGRGERIVFTNGCFDLLHAGHVTYLAMARRLGNRLVVGLNTDRSVTALKGPSRPVMQEVDRARVLAALASVDAVVLFDEETPIDLIKALQPNVLAKGADYTEDRVVGAKEVRSWGGEVMLIPLVDGKSTTSIIETLESAPSQKKSVK